MQLGILCIAKYNACKVATGSIPSTDRQVEGSAESPVLWDIGVSFLGVKRPELTATHLTASSSEV
jgi:hypothetical protein